MSKIIGIDLGTKKTGLAYSDESGILAFSWKTIEINIQKILTTLVEIITNDPKRAFSKIVFGLPSQEGEWKTQIQAFALKLKSALQEKDIDIPIVFQNEDFSSYNAQKNILEIKSTLKKKKRLQINTTEDDAEAARIMLQNYLDKL